MEYMHATRYLHTIRSDVRNQALFESCGQFEAFIGGVDYLKAGHFGEFGRHLGMLADECSLDQLGRLMVCFAPAFNEAMVAAQLADKTVQ